MSQLSPIYEAHLNRVLWFHGTNNLFVFATHREGLQHHKIRTLNLPFEANGPTPDRIFYGRR